MITLEGGKKRASERRPDVQNAAKRAKTQVSYRSKEKEEEEENNGGRLSPEIYEQGERADGDCSHARGWQSERTEQCAEREGDEENSSLLNHQDPRVRLRALTCLHAHIDVLSCDAAGINRLSEALHGLLPREGNPHVAQQIMRLIASLVIVTSRQRFRESDNLEHGSRSNLLRDTVIEHTFSVHQQGNAEMSSWPNHDYSSHSNVEGDIKIGHHSEEPVLTKSCRIDKVASPPTPEPTLHMVTVPLLDVLAETDSLTLKLQTLRSLYQIAKETGSIPLISLQAYLPKLLASSNPYIRAHSLRLVAMVMVTSTDTVYLPSKEDSLGFFEEYTRDSNAFVRMASLQSFVLLCSNGYMLTNGCYQAALSLLQDLNASNCTLALQVISLWVKQDPKERTNHAFLQVRALLLNVVAHFFNGPARASEAIIEVMVNLLNDDCKHVRLHAAHALIYVAHQYGLQINDNDL